MARATTGDQRHLGAIPVGAHHHLDVGIAIQARQLAIGGAQRTINGLCYQRFPAVDELFHGTSLLKERRGRHARHRRQNRAGCAAGQPMCRRWPRQYGDR